MDQTSKDTVLFCLDFVKNQHSVQSQNVQCRNWIAMAIKLIDDSDLGAKDFIVANLKEVDGYFSGVNANATSNTVLDKLELVRSLM